MVRAVLFDLDDTIVPLQTIARWQWAWRPNGPVLPERHAHAAIRRELHAWDRRRWRGISGAEPPTTFEEYWSHLRETLLAVADRPLPEEEVRAVVERFLKPAGPLEPFPDVAPAFRHLESLSVPYGIVTPLPEEVGRGFLRRAGLEGARLLATAPDSLPVPDRAAFRRIVADFRARASETLYIGDLYWSDARAAARAGLRAVLIDRDDRTPPASGPRIRSLSELPAVLSGETAHAAPETAADPAGSPPP